MQQLQKCVSNKILLINTITLAHERNTNPIGIISELADYVTGKVLSKCVALDQTRSSRAIFFVRFPYISTTTTLPISDCPITFADEEIFREKRSPNPIAHAIFLLLKQFLCCSSNFLCCSSNFFCCSSNFFVAQAILFVAHQFLMLRKQHKKLLDQ